MGDVSTFFNAKNFAVVGASRDQQKVGHVIFKNLLQSEKQVFPINPKASQILEKKSYADLLEVPHEIDCIIVAIPAKLIPLILRQAGRRKVKSAVIISAGFSENGNQDLQERILKIAKQENITILGPNTYGFINPQQKVNATYFEGLPKTCKTAFISQSGAIGSAILDKINKTSGFVSLGNSAQADFIDFIKYFSEDQNTKVITLYIESLKEGRGRKFIDTCKKCKKPIIALKSGKSKRGQAAAQSHTAALASENGVYSGILKQAGVIEVDTIKELFDVAKILEKYPKIKNKAAIITNAGGLGVLTTDACEENNIKIPHLSKHAIKKLNQILPESWSNNNPIDLIGDALAKDYEKTIEIIEKENFDFTIVLLTPQYMTEELETAKALLKTKKPIFACFLGGKKIIEAKKFMNQFKIIHFDDPKEMCKCINKSMEY